MSRQIDTQYINQGVRQVWAVGTVVAAGICGTGSDAILSFTNVAVNGVGIADASSAVLGTVINITRAGLYHCSLTYIPTAGGTVNHLGITLNTDAAGLINDPGMATTGIGDFGSVLSPAGLNQPIKLTFVATITKALAAATAHIRFHAGDGANAAPAVGDLTEAECRFEVTLMHLVI